MKRPKFEWLARGGYSARGIVFLLVAGLALFSSFGSGKADTKSALDALLDQPLGKVWLGLIGIGLIGFVMWRLAQSILNADNHSRGAKGFLIRAALLGSAVTYLGLASYAFRNAAGVGSGGTGGEKDLASWAMSQPFGPYLAGAIGAGLVIGGVVTSLKGITGRFEHYLQLDQSSILKLLCVYGLVSRGLVFGIVGVFFCYAALNVDPGQAGSMSDALRFVRQLPLGGILYLIVAMGLAAFGIYNLVEARYRTVSTPSVSGIKSVLPLSER